MKNWEPNELQVGFSEQRRACNLLGRDFFNLFRNRISRATVHSSLRAGTLNSSSLAPERERLLPLVRNSELLPQETKVDGIPSLSLGLLALAKLVASQELYDLAPASL
ncbi:MAG: hypothetical protein BMS9Abin37_0828 [Acidobacteriota bacterium]|nr:MAG: hypothetical protein BMS9Abin37_0828 [Acidobacteriota bacterium]